MNSFVRVSQQTSMLPSRSSTAPAPTPVRYVCVPHKLLTAAAYDPLAIGIYSLIARLYLVIQAPVPLSSADVQRYDPALSRGAIIRALDRLTHAGWLAISEQIGHKTCYLPTWGQVGSTARPWRMDLPHLGRPRHLHALRLDLRLLDTYLGKITLHPTRPALIARYVTQPLLGLRDVGAYALTLADIPTETPLLKGWGLIQHGHVQPVPPDQAILVLVSQLALEDDQAIQLTPKGLHKLGISVSTPREEGHTRGQIPAVMPPTMIDAVIGRGIAEVIGQEDINRATSTAARCGEPVEHLTQSATPWESLGTHEDHGIPPQPPRQRMVRGGGRIIPTDSANRVGSQPDTEVAQLLHALNVRPRQIAELAAAPVDLVRAAIADGRARSDVRDLAGWVVALVRDARDQGWRIAPSPPPPADAHAAALRASFDRLCTDGLDRVDAAEPSIGVDELADAAESVDAEVTSTAVVADGAVPAIDIELPCETLTDMLRCELRARTYPDLHPLIDRLMLRQVDDTLRVNCMRAADLPTVQARLLPLLRAVLRDLGWSQCCRLVVEVARMR